MPDKVVIFEKIVSILVELFEVEECAIQLDSNLYNDLGIDSIDAIDLIVELKKMTGRKIKPEDFKAVRTVADVVDAVAELLGGR